MGRILVVLLGLGAVFGAAWWYVEGRAARESTEDGDERPTRALQNVRTKADEIEDDAQRRLEALDERTRGE